MTRLRLSLALLTLLSLAACGFHLRVKADLPFTALYVETSGYSQFVAELKRAISAGSNARITEREDQADAMLTIDSESRERIILSLSGGGKVREFQLRYKVAYRLRDSGGKTVMSSGEIFLKRDLIYDDTQILAKESEEVLLYRDMQNDAVQQLLRRLSAVRLPS
jgi:LPS-assembly lipoprotein